MKKVIAMMQIFAMLLPFSLFSHATATGKVPTNHSPAGQGISSVEEFLAMEADGVYYLTADLDFSGKTYSSAVYGKTFRGVLDGNGHALLGITVEAENSDAGIFANGFSGQLSNLTIGSAEDPAIVRSTGAPYSVGGIAGTMTDGAKFTNVCLYAEIKGDGKTAGITSYLPDGTVTVENCEMIGSVTGNPAAGFIAMSHDGGQLNAVITDSTNRATVTGSNLGAGGFYAAHSMVVGTRPCSLTVRGCINLGAITASDWRVGGIVGEFHENVNSTLDVSYCYNVGAITMTGEGGYAGGIVGGMAFDAPVGSRVVRYCYNRGTVRSSANATRAFDLAFSNSPGSQVIVENCAYVAGTPTGNAVEKNLTPAALAKEMETVVTAYPAGEGGESFVADQSGRNEGYPVLAREIAEHANVITYDCGRRVCLDCGEILSNPEEEHHSNAETITAPKEYTDGYITAECRYCHNRSVRIDEPCAAHLDQSNGVYSITKPDHLMWYASSVELGLLTGGETLSVDADLDFTGFDYTPIPTFTGTLLGNGHQIKALTVRNAEYAGLIGVLGMGAAISEIAFDGLSANGSKSAGAVAGAIGQGVVVRISGVAVTDAAVKSEDTAGGIVGSSESAAELSVTNTVVDALSVEGKTVGGIVGSGDHLNVKNCYIHANLTGDCAGTVAYHTVSFIVKDCYYAVEGNLTQKDGMAVSEDAFASGEIAYQANTFGAVRLFGVKEGKTTLSDFPMKRVREGSKKSYTDKALPAGDGGLSGFFAQVKNGILLILVQKRNGPIRLVDQKITVGGDVVAFADLTLTGYAETGDGFVTAQGEAVLYTLFLPGIEVSPEVKIGDATLNISKA